MGFQTLKFGKRAKETQSQPSRYLYVSGAGAALNSSREVLRQMFEKFGRLDDSLVDDDAYEAQLSKEDGEVLERSAFAAILFPPNLRYCFVAFENVDDAVKAFEDFSVREMERNAARAHGKTGKSDLPEDEMKSELDVHVRYAHLAAVKGAAPLPECTSVTDSTVVPGMLLIHEYITPEEEQEWLAGVCHTESATVSTAANAGMAQPSLGTGWRENMTRRVQHFGFQFNYTTLGIDYAKVTPPFPKPAERLAHRLEDNWRRYFDILPDGEYNWDDISSGSAFRANNIPAETITAAEDFANVEGSKARAVGSVDSSAKFISRYEGPNNVSDRVREAQREMHFPLNQMTVNEYYSGQGIASHIDTQSCFGKVLFLVSLESGIVMNLTQRSACDSTQVNVPHKCIYLPPRSLLVLSGAARDNWAHGIATRRLDQIPIAMAERYVPHYESIPMRQSWGTAQPGSVLLPRSRRVSLTFRHVLPPASPEVVRDMVAAGLAVADDTRKPHSLVAPADDLSVKVGDMTIEELKHVAATSTNEEVTRRANEALEKKYVVDFYNAVAVHWHHTRAKRKVFWRSVQDFLLSLPSYSLVGDVGSGDGKYLELNPLLTMIGCDRSWELLRVSRHGSGAVAPEALASLPEESASALAEAAAVAAETAAKAAENDVEDLSSTATLNIFCADIVSLPWRSDSMDAAICIAVLHHLSSAERRLQAIHEILRILRPGGKALIQVWALEQTEEAAYEGLPDEMKPASLLSPPPVEADGNNKGKGKRRKAPPTKHRFDTQDTFVSWKLPKRFVIPQDEDDHTTHNEKMSTAKLDSALISADLKGQIPAPYLAADGAPSADGDELIVYQRYCHVYRRGELEALCAQIPHCRVVESGWEAGNWHICLERL